MIKDKTTRTARAVREFCSVSDFSRLRHVLRNDN